jgi:hypothetical protein
MTTAYKAAFFTECESSAYAHQDQVYQQKLANLRTVQGVYVLLAADQSVMHNHIHKVTIFIE